MLKFLYILFYLAQQVNLNKATIKNLLDALGALYILNVYYKDEVKKIGRYVDEIDDHYGSEIFLVHIYQATQMDVKSKMDDTLSLIHQRS